MKKIKDIIIISSIILILIGIYITKKQNNKEIKYKKGFELNIDENYVVEDDVYGKEPLLIELGSETCQPCREMKPILKRLNKELQGKAKIKYLDVYKYNEVSKNFNYKILPTQIFFNEGKVYAAHEGLLSHKEIMEVFKEMGYDFDK